ncbi:NDR1/HIN1-like protein 3 [Prunus avium]|uniref:NDR1/HIN1-like protein 3 n=1 Tax=Prunus avium TaxID=42229 RepID=A0A6P5U3Q5_PRUAV|nr:NDR1/HIN1-like protein 3 [Prunus avium]
MAWNWQKCCCCCCVLIIVFFIAILTGTLVIREYSPQHSINYQVTDASLTQFNLTTNKILQFNLATTINVENPNKRSDFHYEKFEAVASYKSQDLKIASFDPFEVEDKGKHPLNAVFKGEQSVSLLDDEVSKFKATTVFDIVIKLNVKHWAKYTAFKITEEMKMKCNLKVPLNSNGKSTEKFEVAKCEKE